MRQQTVWAAVFLAAEFWLGTSNAADVSEFVFKERILAESYGGRYASQALVTKKDIFITGDAIDIDAPLLSNGGDIVIFGNRVTIRAPLDTRIYLDHAGYFDTAAGCSSQAWALEQAPGMQAAFRDYYQKTFVWNPTKRWWQLATAARFAELPQGQTPAFCGNERQPGTDAPRDALLREATRSGNITIIARDVTFCETCLPRQDMEYRPSSIPDYPVREASDDSSPVFAECRNFGEGRPKPGDNFTVVETPLTLHRIQTGMFLVTAGMTAGRGGAGQTIGCRYPGGRGFFCVTDVAGGRFGTAGVPGPAGSIKIVLVNQASNHPNSRPDSYYESRSAYKAGDAEHHPLQTPSYERLARFPNRCVFSPIAAPYKTAAESADDGKFELLHVDSLLALDVLGTTLARLDARLERDFAPVVQSDATVVKGMTQSEHLTVHLLRTVLRMQSELVSSLQDGAARRPTIDPLFASLTAGNAPPRALSNVQKTLVSKLSALVNLMGAANNGYQLAALYLVNTGGLLNMTGQDIIDQLSALELSFELNQIRQKVIDLANELASLRIDLQEYFAGPRQEQLAGVVAQLRASAAAIEQKIKEQNEGPGWIELTQYYVDTLKLIYSGIIQPYQSGFKNGSYGGVLTTAKDVYVRFSSFGRKDHSLYAQGAALREQAEKANQVLLAFIQYVERERDAILYAKSLRLRELREAKARLLAKQVGRAVLFDEVLRQTIVHYLSGKSEDQWRSNLSSLLQLTDLGSSTQLPFTLPVRSTECEAADVVPEAQLRGNEAFVKCIRIERKSRHVSVFARGNESIGRIAIMRLRPQDTPHTLNTFRLFEGKAFEIVGRE